MAKGKWNPALNTGQAEQSIASAIIIQTATASGMIMLHFQPMCAPNGVQGKSTNSIQKGQADTCFSSGGKPERLLPICTSPTACGLSFTYKTDLGRPSHS